MRLLNVILVAASAAAPALASSVCVPGTLASYIALPPGGCTNGPFNMTDFAFAVLPGDTVPITAANIDVTPIAAAPEFSLEFTSPLFTVGPTDRVDILIAYYWDPGTLDRLDEIMNDPVTPPALSQLSIFGCENSNFIGNVCPTTSFMLVLSATNPSQTVVMASQPFPPGVTTLGMNDTVEIEGNGCTGPPVCADITSFSDTVNTVPEPSSGWLVIVASGLGALMAAVRRRRN